MNKMYVLNNKKNKPIPAEISIETDLGYYTIDKGAFGKILLLNGTTDDLTKYVTSNQEIWIGFMDRYENKSVTFEFWSANE